MSKHRSDSAHSCDLISRRAARAQLCWHTARVVTQPRRIGLGAARILMIGTKDIDLYIVLTLFTVFGYLVFRVFRQFFMFQPRPDTK